MYRAIEMFGSARNSNIVSNVNGSCVIHAQYQSALEDHAHIGTNIPHELNLFASVRGSRVLGCRGLVVSLLEQLPAAAEVAHLRCPLLVTASVPFASRWSSKVTILKIFMSVLDRLEQAPIMGKKWEWERVFKKSPVR